MIDDLLDTIPQESSSNQAKTLVLWGDTAVGKTTLLTCALFSDQNRLLSIDWKRSAQAISPLLTNWQNLKLGRPVEGTGAHYNLALTCRGGAGLHVRDVQGGKTRRPGEAQAVLHDGDVILFLLEWGDIQNEHQLLALEGALHACEQKPKGLVLTKAERFLQNNDPAWSREMGWWQRYDWARHRMKLLQRFEDAIWPTSCYGYHGLLPACTLGEYGLVLPRYISPKGVCDPFAWALDRMGLS